MGVTIDRTRALLAGAIALLALLIVPLPALRVEADGDVYERIISPGRTIAVSLSYVHSVEKTRVEEEYDVRPSGIVMRSMAWQSFGAGLPDRYDECANGWYVKYTDTRLGDTLSYWFLPLNEVQLDVGAKRVFEGPERESMMVVSVRHLPMIACLVALPHPVDLPL